SITSEVSVAGSPLGVAAVGAGLFYTTSGSQPWKITPGLGTAPFSTSTDAAQGPIVGDLSGVYWPTATSNMMASDLRGAKATSLSPVPDPPVSALALDTTFVYWTDQSGAVYQVSRGGGKMPVMLNPPDPSNANPAWGIAVSPSDGTVYFAQGGTLFKRS